MEHPITQAFLSLTREHRQANFQAITDSMINVKSVGDIDLYKIAQLKGQVHALDLILEIESFMSELIKPIDGVTNESI